MKRQRVFSRIDDSRAARDDVAVVENRIGKLRFDAVRFVRKGDGESLACFLYLNEYTAVFPATEASIAGSFKST